MSGASGMNGKTAAANAPGLDFDRLALERATERVAKAGGEWWLRWDVPAEVLVQRLLLREIAERTAAVQQEIEAAGAGADVGEQVTALRERMVAEWDAYRADVLGICHALFAHTYPQMTAEEVATHFNTNEQRAIIEHFFTLPTRRSSPPPSDGSGAPATETETETSSPTETSPIPQTRASRRGATSKRRH